VSAEDGKWPRFVFSREIRLGDLITVLGVGVATIAAWQRVDFRLDVIERAQGAQHVTNTELRSEIREVSVTINKEMKEQGQGLRRIEDKINRARL